MPGQLLTLICSDRTCVASIKNKCRDKCCQSRINAEETIHVDYIFSMTMNVLTLLERRDENIQVLDNVLVLFGFNGIPKSFKHIMQS